MHKVIYTKDNLIDYFIQETQFDISYYYYWYYWYARDRNKPCPSRENIYTFVKNYKWQNHDMIYWKGRFNQWEHQDFINTLKIKNVW